MADVQRLPKTQNKAPGERLINQTQSKYPIKQKFASEPPSGHQKYDQSLTHGDAPGLDRRTKLRLRRGRVMIEARLDLHGMTQDSAREALFRFLERAYMGGKKTVLVVTGKGLRADGRIGVLRQAVPRWLNELPARQWVHAFDHAAPRDGGEGALYIVMRRRR